VKDAQVSSELGQIVTERPAETMSQPHTYEMVGAGKAFDISDFFNRWQLLSTGLLQTTDTALTDMLGSSYYPISTYLNVAAVRAKTQNYAQWHGDIEIMFTVTAPSNAYGLYVLQALPDTLFAASSSSCNAATSDNPWTSTQGIHAFVDITTSNSVIFKLPYYSQVLNNFLPNSDAQMWRLLLWCLAPIQNAVNADTIAATYNIYARMPGINIDVPYYQSGKGASSTLKRGLATAQKFKEDKTISKTAGKIASLAATASTIPFLAPFAGPVAAGAASVMSVASMFGFTREAAPEKPVDVHPRSFSSVVNVDGQDGSEIVALMQSNNVPYDPAAGGGSHEDEMSFASLFRRWTIVDTFSWDTSATALTNINTIPVTPYFCKQVLGACYPTVAGFVGFPFSRWRGTMEYKLIIPSSVYHRGMLQVFWTPDVGGSLPATDITQILHNEIFDVEAGSEYTFTVNWSTNNPFRSNNGMQTKTTGFNVNDVNGFLVFRVISQLQAVGGSAPVTCVLLARAHDNMEFGIPRQVGSLYSGGTQVVLPLIAQFQGKDVGDGEEDDSISFELVPCATTNADKLGGVMFGEQVRSTRALVQKMSVIAEGYSATAWTPIIAVPHFYPPPFTYPASPFIVNPPGINPLSPPWTWYGHYAAMFGCVRGSTRYKVLAPFMGSGANYVAQAAQIHGAEATTFVASLLTGTTNSVNFSGSDFSAIQCSGNGGVEYTLPYYTSVLFRSPCDQPVSPGNGRSDVINLLASGGFAGQQVIVYSGAGPDVSLFRFRRVPPMVVHV